MKRVKLKKRKIQNVQFEEKRSTRKYNGAKSNVQRNKKNLNKSWIFNRIKEVMTSGQEKETIKNRKLMKTYLNEGIMFQPQQVEELGSFSHMVLALESRIEEGVMESPSVTKESC